MKSLPKAAEQVAEVGGVVSKGREPLGSKAGSRAWANMWEFPVSHC